MTEVNEKANGQAGDERLEKIQKKEYGNECYF